MNVRRSIREHIRSRTADVDVAADVNAEIAVNTGGPGRTTVSRSVQNTAVTQSKPSSVPSDRVPDDRVPNDEEQR